MSGVTVAETSGSDACVGMFMWISVDSFRKLRDMSLRDNKTLSNTVNEVLKEALERCADEIALKSEIRKAIRSSCDSTRNHVQIEVKWSIVQRFKEVQIPPYDLQTGMSAFLEAYICPPL